MLFNSLDFAIFLPIVFLLYWSIPVEKSQYRNGVLLISSYIFYGWWDWRFLSLILISSTVDFYSGKLIQASTNPLVRKSLLTGSLCINLGMLGFFKYFTFFVDSFSDAFAFMGYEFNPLRLNLILPVGISFYTFQTLSYTIDIYNKKYEPKNNLLIFLTFVSFFPQLVAGPIERAKNLIPQFEIGHRFNSQTAIKGVNQIIWGLFKKLVIADSCKNYADAIFQNYEHYSSPTLILGAIYFGFQIYGDFSGYSDIAIGTARLFGFEFKTNFKYPYFSRDISEFWRRWHISLSTWFRDYLYIPLGGSQTTKLKKIRNIFVIFVISGFWHGANWTFVIWGALNALYFLPLLLLGKNRTHMNDVAHGKALPSLQELLQMTFTFTITSLAWIFFRSETVVMALDFIAKIFMFNFKIDYLNIERYPFEMIPILFLLILLEWPARHKEFPLESVRRGYFKVLFILFCILTFGSFSSNQQFIYFQF